MKLTLPLFSIFLACSLILTSCNSDDSGFGKIDEPIILSDIDGNLYQTVTIGDQVWMAENLKVKTFNDGVAITEWEFGDDWYNLNNPLAYWQWASTFDLNNVIDEELPEDYYGALYNEFVLSSGKLAPAGWRIPTVADFEELEAYLNVNGFQGSDIKSTSGWSESSGSGQNAFDFNALPNGYAAAGGTATGSEVIASFATSATVEATRSRTIVNLHNESTFGYFDNSKALGAGVRLIKE